MLFLPYIILILVLLLNRGVVRNTTCVSFCIQLLTAMKCLKYLLIPWYYKYLDKLFHDYIFACLLWYRLIRIWGEKIHNAKKLRKTEEVHGVLCISRHICVACSTHPAIYYTARTFPAAITLLIVIFYYLDCNNPVVLSVFQRQKLSLRLS